MGGAVAILTLTRCDALHARADAPPVDSTVVVTVLDVDTGSPVEAAKVVATRGDEPLGSGTTDSSGMAAFRELPELSIAEEGKAVGPPVVIEVIHPDYDIAQVILGSGARELTVLVSPIPTTVGFVETAVVHPDVLRPTTNLRGIELHESVSSSIPDTIAVLPGVDVAYNGPGAARPTIRGLGGDRVLMLDDGFLVGDLYWSAADHGVMAEPLLARRIEVVRGPATLAFGGNALGGVVNVVTEQIPEQTESVSAMVGTQFESASLGIAQAGSVVVPIGPVSLRLEESVRHSQDVQTPLGAIPNTDVKAFGGGGGFAWHPTQGTLGASVRYYQNTYGIPGEFNGVLIEGGHPGGASIEASRLNARLLAEYLPSRSRGVESVELGASFTRYDHDEIEGIIDGRQALGAAFDLDTLQSNLIVRHELLDKGKLTLRGAAGVSALALDLSAGGNSPGVRSGTDWGVAGFLFERLDVKSWSFHVGVRYEHRRLAPLDTSPISVRTEDRVIEKPVTDRNFNLLSFSVAALWEFAEGWTLGLTVARSSRAPNLQELYSDGPHLADFSYDIGSPNLPVEVGRGVDLFLLADLKNLGLEVTGFVNLVDNYVIYTPTLETIRVFREGVRPRDTPVFEALAVDALFAGAEGRVHWWIGAGFSLHATLSYVWAERRGDSDPLPFIPPLGGRVTFRYERSGFFGTLGLIAAFRQSRVPGPVDAGGVLENPQEPTAGYVLAAASAGWSGDRGPMNHTVTLRAFNFTNTVWRDHLSRIKDVAPQMGLNVVLTYRFLY